MALTDKLTAIANAIRGKSGKTETLTLDQMPTEITNLPTGGIDTSDATATAGDIMAGKTAYAKGEKITGSYEEPVVTEFHNGLQSSINIYLGSDSYSVDAGETISIKQISLMSCFTGEGFGIPISALSADMQFILLNISGTTLMLTEI